MTSLSPFQSIRINILMSDPYYNISIYDGAPIEGIVPPIEDPPEKRLVENSFGTVNAKLRVTHRKYTQQTELYFDDPSANHKSEGWQTDVFSPSVHTGPLQGHLKDWIEERISWHTGSTQLAPLRSWWSILTNNMAVPKHGHTYQTKTKTISGILWIQGDICPLYVQNKNDEIPDLINNVPGRCVIFANSCDHWTDPYPHHTVRAGISFDYLVKDQEVCACKGEQICIRCVHIAKNLKKIGVENVYSGGTQTISYGLKNSIIKNPYFNRLPDDYK